MLKFIKHNLEGIDGVEIYPIISLLLFFTVFITMIVFVFKLPKKVRLLISFLADSILSKLPKNFADIKFTQFSCKQSTTFILQ